MGTEFPILELRQYLLQPGMRDELIELFEREFIEPQEAIGMRLFGLFRDRDRPDYFVWLRGFRDIQSRAKALGEFYDGAVWKTHREAANATMIDSDNVLLLREARMGSGFDAANTNVAGPLYCAVFPLTTASECAEFAQQFMNEVRPEAIAGAYVTEAGLNTFPRLPVRQGEHHFVVFTAGVPAADLSAFASRPSQIIDLIPTARSRLQLIGSGSHAFGFPHRR